MRATAFRVLCVLGLLLTPLAVDAAGTKKATSAKSSRTRTHAKATPKAPSATATASPARTAGPRRLEDIHIEGEVPVPQVLFITARDQRRFLESHHDLYLRTSKELGEATPLPARVVLTPTAPTTAPATTPVAPPAPASTPAKKESGR
jgi:hypothetical protein